VARTFDKSAKTCQGQGSCFSPLWESDGHAACIVILYLDLISSLAEKENIVEQKYGQPPDDVSSAPESGTVRDDTSGNAPSDRGLNPGQGTAPGDNTPEKDDPSIASEER
jgi:hypothetical protein